MGMIYCPTCGKSISDQAAACPNCGCPIHTNGKTIIVNNYNGTGISTKSRLACALFCFFLGLLGIHRFYVGKVGTGILQLLLSCTGIGEIWAIIDFIVILCGGFRDQYGNVVSNW